MLDDEVKGWMKIGGGNTAPLRQASCSDASRFGVARTFSPLGVGRLRIRPELRTPRQQRKREQAPRTPSASRSSGPCQDRASVWSASGLPALSHPERRDKVIGRGGWSRLAREVRKRRSPARTPCWRHPQAPLSAAANRRDECVNGAGACSRFRRGQSNNPVGSAPAPGAVVDASPTSLEHSNGLSTGWKPGPVVGLLTRRQLALIPLPVFILNRKRSPA